MKENKHYEINNNGNDANEMNNMELNQIKFDKDIYVMKKIQKYVQLFYLLKYNLNFYLN